MSLRAIARTYVNRIRPRAEEELAWFRHQPTLASAIECAALAINSRCKRYRHQTRLKRVSLQQAKKVLSANRRRIAKCRTFDELISLIEVWLQPINGLGELYTYDTALRIGAKLKLLPARIYLHAGTRVGARALGFDGKVRTLERSQQPSPLRRLAAHELEDVLCIFKDRLKKASSREAADELKARSWCA